MYSGVPLMSFCVSPAARLGNPTPTKRITRAQAVKYVFFAPPDESELLGEDGRAEHFALAQSGFALNYLFLRHAV
jgi:hypothetical protein